MARVNVAWIAREDCNPDDMDFSRKAHLVAGGHTTETPTAIIYSSVVSRDSIRLSFLIAELNVLHIMSCVLQNAYLNAKCKEKIWFVGGKECSEDQGNVL
eukprot:12315372-Ditylum_brightwellii.AAC.1